MSIKELTLKKLKNFSGREGPLVLIIMDGIGLRESDDRNAFHLANTPFLDMIQTEWPKKNLYIQLKAHGTAVGLPSDNEMGNSEVGHNAIGAGNVRGIIQKFYKGCIDDFRIYQEAFTGAQILSLYKAGPE